MNGTRNFGAWEYAAVSSGLAVPAQYVANAERVLVQLQKIRDVVGSPIIITNGYRSSDDNDNITGASKTSQHMTASAADFVVPALSKHDAAVLIESALPSLTPFGQFIAYLPDSHFHISIGTKSERLLCTSKNPAVYIPYPSGATAIPRGFSMLQIMLAIVAAGVAAIILLRVVHHVSR